MTRDTMIVIGAAVVLAGALAWQVRAGAVGQVVRGGRAAGRSGVSGLPLDATRARLTPEALRHFAPAWRSGGWVAHRCSYPATPGLEMERLIHGVPGSCNQTTPRALRGWLFAPPSEVDF